MTPDRPVYEELGQTYSAVRAEDPRIATQLRAALGEAATVLNVGAGTGNYEPADRSVVAIDPSPTMIRQRGRRRAPAIIGVAESLPFDDGSFDAAMAVLTLHHWTDVDQGLSEMRRVSSRQVVLFFEPLLSQDYWLLDYFPEIAELPNEVDAPSATTIGRVLDILEVQPVLVPRDCTDGFAAAYWARPEAYLDPLVQAGMSSMAKLPADALASGTARLRADLATGRWEERHGHLRSLPRFDGGYRLAIAR